MRYVTRNHAFAPAVTWVLDGGRLRLEEVARPPQEIALTEVQLVRLEFAPTRPEPNRFRCRLNVRTAMTLEFFNRTYRGVYDFADTSVEYVAFVRALHAALAEHAPGCRFVAGATTGAYALSWAATIFSGLMVVLAALFLLFNGLAWLILLKIALLAIFAPNVFRWLARNHPRAYPPAAVPAEMLPVAGPAAAAKS
jgi:hypothetical protein